MLDPGRIWIALRYIENNPVRAGIVDRVEGYPWSSGRQHLTGKFPRNSLLDQAFWRDNGGVQNWKDLIGVPAPLSLEERELRRCTFGGQPFGDEQFVSGMELAFNRKWPRRPPLTEGETADAAEA